jgi:hypothetical protein
MVIVAHHYWHVEVALPSMAAEFISSGFNGTVQAEDITLAQVLKMFKTSWYQVRDLFSSVKDVQTSCY